MPKKTRLSSDSAAPEAAAPAASFRKQLSNPRSTGGAGHTFELRVQASYLLALLSGEPTVLLQHASTVGLQFQARVLSFSTDDLVCTLVDATKRERKVLLQVKQTLKALPSNGAFTEALAGAWYDVHNPEVFDVELDRIVVVFDADGDSNVQGAITLAEFAKTSRSGTDFHRKVFAPNFSNDSIRTAYRAVEKVVQDVVAGPVTADTIQRFLKSVAFVSHHLSSEDTTEFAGLLSRIKLMLGPAFHLTPNAVWDGLVSACARLNQVAAAVTLENLDEQVEPLTAAAFARHRNSGASQLGLSGLPATLAADGAEPPGWTPRVSTPSAEPIGPGVALPGGRPDAANQVIGRQLDGVNEKLKCQRYEDARDDLASLGKDMRPFDEHQRARWYLQRGVARWHLGEIGAAAEDFLAAADLSDDDDKMVAARIRGLTLQKKTEDAVRVGDEARRRFPDSEHVWVAWANAQIIVGATLSHGDVPFVHRECSAVYQMLSWGRRIAQDFSAALEFSRKSLKAPDANFYTRHDALSLAVEVATQSGVHSTYRITSKEVRSALKLAVESFEPRAERLWRVQAPRTVEETATHLGYAFLLLEQPERALEVAQEASARGVESATLCRVELDALSDLHDVERLKNRGRFLVSKLEEPGLVSLAQAAANLGDLELVDLAIQAAAHVSLSREDTLATLESIRLMGMYHSPLRLEAVSRVRTLELNDATPLTTLLAVCRILFAEGDKEAAESSLALAREAANRDGTEEAKLLLAELMQFTEHHPEAAKLYGGVLPLGQHTVLHNRWLQSLVRSEDRRGAKRLLESFPLGWVDDDFARSLATELAQSAGDWGMLKQLSDAQSRVAPSNASSVLFAYAVACRSEPVAAIVEMLAGVSPDLAGTVQQRAQVAALEMRFGHVMRGMERLYRLRRENLESIEAASALVIACIATPTELPGMEEVLPAIGPGSSARLLDGAGKEVWLSIDPEHLVGLPETSEFKSATSPHVQAFMGKTVGAEVLVPMTFGGSRTLTVAGISSVHRRLLAVAHESLRTSLVPVPNAVVMKVHGDSGEQDFSGVLEQLKRSGESGRQAFRLYGTQPCTLGFLGKLLGKSPIVLASGWPSDGPALFTCDGTDLELHAGLALLSDESATYVVDAVTLSELAMLGRLDALSSLPKVMVCTLTRDLVVGQLTDAREARSSLTAFEDGGKLGVIEVSPADRAREVAYLEGILAAIDDLTEVVPAYGPEEVPPLINTVKELLSDEEYSVLLLARERGAHLFTTDGRLRAWAAQVQIRGAWPQLVFMAAAERGALSRDNYATSVGRLFLANRDFVMLTGYDLAAVCRQGTGWLQAAIIKFKRYANSPAIIFSSVLGTAFQFLLEALNGSISHRAFGILVDHVTEGLARSAKCPEDLVSRLATLLSRALFPPQALYVYPVAGALRKAESEQLAEYYAPYILRGISHSRGDVVARPVEVRVVMVGKTPCIHATEAAAPTLSDVEPVEGTPAQRAPRNRKAQRRRLKKLARRG